MRTHTRARAAQLENLRSVPTTITGGTMDPLYQWFLTILSNAGPTYLEHAKTFYMHLLPIIPAISSSLFPSSWMKNSETVRPVSAREIVIDNCG